MGEAAHPERALLQRLSEGAVSGSVLARESGQTRAAVADYDAALRIDPSHSSALYGRGIAWSRLGDKAQSELDFARALALNGTVDRDYARYGVQ